MEFERVGVAMLQENSYWKIEEMYKLILAFMYFVNLALKKVKSRYGFHIFDWMYSCLMRDNENNAIARL